MTIRSVTSAIALVTALTLSGAAVAQSSIAGVPVPADRVLDVQTACNTLAGVGDRSLVEQDDSTATGSTAMAGDANVDAATGDSLDTVIASLSEEDCEAAGF